MAVWGVVFLVALSGISVFAEESLIFPENARGVCYGYSYFTSTVIHLSGLWALYVVTLLTWVDFGYSFRTYNPPGWSMGPSRIVSGWEANEGQFPYQLSLRMVSPVGGVTACGGTILHKMWGMTAAHCTATRVTIVIRAGLVNMTRPDRMFETTEYYNHHLYNDALQQVVQPHDISLLKFAAPITFTDRIQPIRLQNSLDRNRNYAGVRLVASGWGLTWTQGSSPENLNWVFLTGESNLACWLAFGGSSIIVDSTICASHYNVTSQSTCQGDSGGPLTVVDNDGIVSQVGISSFVSSSGCHTDIPAGFIRPGHYHDWFFQVTGINFDWDPETSTTAAPETTDAPVTTEAETDAPSTTEAETDAPSTTEAETDAPSTTEAETDAPSTTEAETDAPSTTEAETDAPSTTEAETDAPSTTEAETDAPSTTEAETDAPSTTEAETDAPSTTEAETDAPSTTEAETDGPSTTEAVTDAPITTEAVTDAPITTEAVTDAPIITTEAVTDVPETTEAETDVPITTEAVTDVPETTEAVTDAPIIITEAETDVPVTTEVVTDAPTTEAETDAPVIEESSEGTSEESAESRSFFSRFNRFWRSI